MDTREYIESGILDLYSAGLLSVEEMRDVELKACQFSEVKTELELIQASLTKYVFNHAMAPPAEVKNRIMMEIERSGGQQVSNDSTKVVQLSERKRDRSLIYLAAASVVLLITVGALALNYSSQVSEYKQRVAVLSEQQASAQNELNSVKQSLGENAEQIALLTHTSTVRVDMKGTALSPQSLALIYWNKDTKSVYLDIKNLPATPSDKQYQLWFIDPVKGPVSAGVFDVKPNELIKMIDATGAAAFAVTLEPKGGSVSPTLDQMYVVGNVPS